MSCLDNHFNRFVTDILPIYASLFITCICMHENCYTNYCIKQCKAIKIYKISERGLIFKDILSQTPGA